jgi:hypothetical protein
VPEAFPGCNASQLHGAVRAAGRCWPPRSGCRLRTRSAAQRPARRGSRLQPTGWLLLRPTSECLRSSGLAVWREIEPYGRSRPAHSGGEWFLLRGDPSGNSLQSRIPRWSTGDLTTFSRVCRFDARASEGSDRGGARLPEVGSQCRASGTRSQVAELQVPHWVLARLLEPEAQRAARESWVAARRIGGRPDLEWAFPVNVMRGAVRADPVLSPFYEPCRRGRKYFALSPCGTFSRERMSRPI